MLQSVVGIVLVWNLIPDAYRDAVAQTALLGGGIMNMIFRTFYTDNVQPTYPQSYDDYNDLPPEKEHERTDVA